MSEVEQAAPETGTAEVSYTPEEQVYIDTRGGEVEAPAAEAKPAVEEKPEEKPAEAKPAEERKLVDKGALDEERARRKALQEEVNQFKIERARWEERFNAIRPQQPQPPPPPSPDEDIFGAVKHQDNTIRQITEKIGAYEKQIAAEKQMRQLAEWASSQEGTFKKETPDYDDALSHLRRTRIGELKSVWGMSDAQVNQQMINEERQLLMAAARMGKNPAELAYQSAKERGYQKKEAKASAEDMSKKLDVIEEGQKASRSLSSVGGKAAGGELSIEQVLKMPDDEFEAWKVKNPAKYRRMKGAEY